MPHLDAARFDAQARQYDARAGLPEAAARDVARALVRLAGAGAGEVLVELGAGTGQLGARLAELGLRYVGLDASPAMLAEFERRRAEASGSIELFCADVNEPWPVADASVRAVFSSRAAHLFDAAHLIREMRRVARGPEAALVLGRVKRDPESLRSVLRRRMRELVREHGHLPNDGDRRQRELLDGLCALGARRIEPEIAAAWTVEPSPRRLLDGWHGKPGLAGAALPRAQKDAILSELEAFAQAAFGSLDAPVPARERYVLEGVLLAEAALA